MHPSGGNATNGREVLRRPVWDPSDTHSFSCTLQVHTTTQLLRQHTMTMIRSRLVLRCSILLALWFACLSTCTANEDTTQDINQDVTQDIIQDVNQDIIQDITLERHEALLREATEPLIAEIKLVTSQRDASHELYARLQGETSSREEFLRDELEAFRGKTSQLEAQLEKATEASKAAELNVKDWMETNQMLSGVLSEREAELTRVKDKWFDVRQELFQLTMKQRELERMANENLATIAWSRFRASKELGPIAEHIETSWAWLLENAVLPLRNNTSILLDTVVARSGELYEEISKLTDQVLVAAAPVLESSEAFSVYRNTVHSTIEAWLQNAVSTVSNYCTLQEPQCPGWVSSSSEYVNTNTGKVASCIEITVLIALCDMLIRIVISIFWSRKKTSPKKASPVVTPTTKAASPTKKTSRKVKKR